MIRRASGAAQESRPSVSVLVPCYNEEENIKECLDSLINPFVVERAEILVIDGGSSDSTSSIVKEYIGNHKGISIRLINNPRRLRPLGLNIGIVKSRGEIIVIADARVRYPKNYIKRCVELLETTGADNVGGVMDPQGKTRFQKLVALAMGHLFGVGDAKFHLGNYSGYVDTVYLGTFRRSIFKKLGYFDPASYINEDADFNLRINKAGGKVYLDGTLRISYLPRDTLKKLIIQYFNYGKGRSRTTLKHKQFTSYRQVAPILLVIGLSIALVLGLLFNPLFLLLPVFYVFLTLSVSFSVLKRERVKGFGNIFILAAIFMAMHISWGLGFFANVFAQLSERKRSKVTAGEYV